MECHSPQTCSHFLACTDKELSQRNRAVGGGSGPSGAGTEDIREEGQAQQRLPVSDAVLQNRPMFMPVIGEQMRGLVVKGVCAG